MPPNVETDGVDFGDDVDEPTFDQILEMDEEDDHEFSKSIVFGFLDQAEQTFNDMDEAMEKKDLERLSSLGHFLKGSSATLGFNKIRDECERIQHYGHKKDETGTIDEPDEAKCLKRIDRSLSHAKLAFDRVSQLMRLYYDKLEE